MQYQVKQDFVGGNNSSQGNSIAVNHSHALSAETVDQSRSASTMNSIFSDHNNFKPTFQRYQGASNYTLSSLNDSAISSPAPARPLFGTANHPQLPSLASIGLPSLAALSARGSMPLLSKSRHSHQRLKHLPQRRYSRLLMPQQLARLFVVMTRGTSISMSCNNFVRGKGAFSHFLIFLLLLFHHLHKTQLLLVTVFQFNARKQ